MCDTDFSDLLRRARTIRRFRQADPIPERILRHLVDLARISPCGGNRQHLRYRLVSGDAACARVFTSTRWAAALPEWGGPKEGERPTGYIAILTPKGTNQQTEAGIAAMVIQLAATADGWGVCMLGAFDRKALTAEFKLGDGHEIILLLALGRPGETVVLEDGHSPEDRPYWRDAAGVHHVPKLPLTRVLV